ncbi:MAG: hypothetical protein WBC44_17615 [Planctomycetaceae bacterium]
MITISAHFDGRNIVPDQPLPLQSGTSLRGSVELAEPSQPRFADLLGLEADMPDAPSDLAAQHDHYLYGSPKR